MPNRTLDQAFVDALLDLGIVNCVRDDDARSVPALPSSVEGIEAAFFLAVYRYAKAWLLERGGEVSDSAPCAFVHLRAVNQEIARLAAAPIAYFKNLPDQDVCGGLYVASGDLELVARTPHPSHPTVTALSGVLESCGLAGCTHAVFRADRKELILRRSGPAGVGPSTLVVVELSAPVRLATEDLERWIWDFHSRFTQLPGGVLLPWIGSPQDRVPVQELERRISGALCFYLNKDLGRDHASTEHYTEGGRLDIKVAEEAMAAGHGHCAIELKVLRSRQPSGTRPKGYTAISANKVNQHALDGVEQADDYRRRIGAGSAYLCCFDARLLDEDQPEVVQSAASLDVRLRRYFMYDTPASFRQAHAAARKAGTLLSGQVD